MLQLLIDLATFFALASVATLCLYIVFTLSDLRKTLGEFNASLSLIFGELKEFRKTITPVVENLEKTTKYSISIAEKVNNQLDLTDKTLGEISKAALRVSELEEVVRLRIVKPLNQIFSFVSGLNRAVATFSDALGKKK